MSPSKSMDAIQTYEEYYVNRDYEQLDLFRLIRGAYEITRVVYPGSYVHISPSFIFPDVVYIDSDRNARKFFKESKLIEFVRERREYTEDPKISFHGIDYRVLLDELRHQFDLLISQYAGFISDTCKEYLRIGGFLLANNSHGDAGLASIDSDYALVATVHKARGKYRISYTALEEYFIPKGKTVVTRELLYETGKGVGYTRTAPLYIFQRVS